MRPFFNNNAAAIQGKQAQLDQLAKTHQKLIQNLSKPETSYLYLQHFWQVLDSWDHCAVGDSSRNLFIGPKRRLSNWFCRDSSKFCSWLTTMCKVRKSPQVAPPPHIWISNPEISVKMKRESWKPLAKVKNYKYWGVLKINLP